MRLFDSGQRVIMPVGCIADARFDNGVLLEWICNAKEPLEFLFCVMPISACSYLSFCTPPWYQLIIVQISSFAFKTTTSLDASADIAMHLPMCGVSFPSYWAAPWWRKLFSAKTEPLVCLPSTWRKQRWHIAVSRSSLTMRMHSLFQKRLSRNSRLRAHFIQKVFPSSFTSSNLLS